MIKEATNLLPRTPRADSTKIEKWRQVLISRADRLGIIDELYSALYKKIPSS